MTIPFARKLHPARGSWERDATGNLARSPSPGMSAVLLVLRTQRGESLADPELGVDWKGARRARGSRTENVRSAVLASLARLVARGVIGAPAVVVRVEDVDAGEREEVDVSFFDAALRERRSVTEPTQ